MYRTIGGNKVACVLAIASAVVFAWLVERYCGWGEGPMDWDIRGGFPVREKLESHTLVTNGDTEALKAFILAGGDILAANSQGWTPLHLAAAMGKPAVVGVLIQAGADIEAQDVEGWRPIHVAAGEGHIKIIEMLAEHGANLRAADNHGRTPADWTTLDGFDERALEAISSLDGR